MPQLSTAQIFISYSRRDEAVTRRVVTFLRRQGMKVWVDNEKLIPGTPIWEEEIEKAINAASAVVVVMSPDSKKSEWVRREISLADQNHKRIFPVLVEGDEDASITLRLITRQYVDLRENEEAGLNALHRALSEYLNELEAQLKEKAHEETEKAPSEKAEKDGRKESSKLETNGLAPLSSRQALITLGWAIAGVIGGIVYDGSEEEIGGAVAGAVGGAIGGLVTGFVLRNENPRLNRNSIFWIALAWAVGLGVGWQIGDLITETIGIAIGYTLGGIISVAIMLSVGLVPSEWKSRAWIVLAWAFGGGLGWFITKKLMIETMNLDYVTSWGVGTAVGWAIGGYVLGWQLLQATKEASQEQFEGKGVIAEFIEKHKVFLLSWKGRSLIGVTVGLILGILYGVLYGIIHDISYDFAYAYSTFYGDVPHIFLLIICGFAGFVAYPHRVTVLLLIGGFIVIFITGLSQRYLLYELLAFGGIYGLPAGALISRILYWLKVVK